MLAQNLRMNLGWVRYNQIHMRQQTTSHQQRTLNSWPKQPAAFSLLTIIVLAIAVLGLAGGIYFYTQSTQKTNLAPDDQVTLEDDTADTPNPAPSANMNFAQLLDAQCQGKPDQEVILVSDLPFTLNSSFTALFPEAKTSLACRGDDYDDQGQMLSSFQSGSRFAQTSSDIGVVNFAHPHSRQTYTLDSGSVAVFPHTRADLPELIILPIQPSAYAPDYLPFELVGHKLNKTGEIAAIVSIPGDVNPKELGGAIADVYRQFNMDLNIDLNTLDDATFFPRSTNTTNATIQFEDALKSALITYPVYQDLQTKLEQVLNGIVFAD
jgi:hypothetical protein